MKFKFKIQSYQTEAVRSLVSVFEGQEFSDLESYKTGFLADKNLFDFKYDQISSDDYDLGFANPKLKLTKHQILKNIQKIQVSNGIEESDSIYSSLGDVELDVEMETGTGKTYVYIKSIFELNKKYGFNKFIVVVPSVAIREGVRKSFEMTAEHFMEFYEKKARYFVYDSKRLDEIEHFSSSDSIQVMIINIQAFNTRSADSRKIYEELDAFQSRRPIDVIAKNRPILILDEPQKMGGASTKESLLKFNPLFSINYSATHKTQHNLIYVLDALDAYNKKLVKKIEVKGFTVKNLRGTNGYLRLENIVLSNNKSPLAKLEFEINYSTKSINRETRLLSVGDNLYERSNHLEVYKDGYVIAEINPFTDSITFTNGIEIRIGDVIGDSDENHLRRIQIRETIKSHLEKEEFLFLHGIKTLSLFFIDEVAKYRQYDDIGSEINGLYGTIFEEEYNSLVREIVENSDTVYSRYLKTISASETHKGYFSIDKKGRKIDSEIKRGSDISDDESTYDLILKEKERLLSFDEPTRFIFTHSALREGWDNPNVFQICTLRHTISATQKHQEVGRGLRLCVNADGDRMDDTIPNLNVHEINKLTVIANNSYEDFVKGLQNEIKDTLRDRPKFVTPEYFENRKLVTASGEVIRLTKGDSLVIYRYMIANDYLNEDNMPSDNYKNALENGNLAPLKPELADYSDSIHKIIQSSYKLDGLDGMFDNANTTKIIENKINDNFSKKEFQNLWKLINRKYSYCVDFDSDELIVKAVNSINSHLFVNRMIYTTSTAEQKEELTFADVKSSNMFKTAKTSSEISNNSVIDGAKYDLIGKVCDLTSLRRVTIGSILRQIDECKFNLYRENPEEFINNISKVINSEKASLIVEHVVYNQIDGEFSANIFMEAKSSSDYKSAFKATKHIRDYVFTEGTAERSIERVFAEDLDRADEVCVYAKLPKAFYIPTPVGNYSPDWAIAFHDGKVRHIYFVAETKGSMDSMQLRSVENAKIECAKKLFDKMSSENVKYGKIDSYAQLLSIINGS